MQNNSHYSIFVMSSTGEDANSSNKMYNENTPKNAQDRAMFYASMVAALDEIIKLTATWADPDDIDEVMDIRLRFRHKQMMLLRGERE